MAGLQPRLLERETLGDVVARPDDGERSEDERAQGHERDATRLQGVPAAPGEVRQSMDHGSEIDQVKRR